MDKQTFDLIRITYDKSLEHIKTKIKESKLVFYTCNHAPNITRVNGLIQEAVDIESKLAFLNKHANYLVGGDPSYIKGSSDSWTINNKHTSDNKRICDNKRARENKIIPPCDVIPDIGNGMKKKIKKEIKQENEVVDENEVVEVSKNDIMRVEIMNELRKKCMGIFDK